MLRQCNFFLRIKVYVNYNAIFSVKYAGDTSLALSANMT